MCRIHLLMAFSWLLVAPGAWAQFSPESESRTVPQIEQGPSGDMEAAPLGGTEAQAPDAGLEPAPRRSAPPRANPGLERKKPRAIDSGKTPDALRKAPLRPQMAPAPVPNAGLERRRPDVEITSIRALGRKIAVTIQSDIGAAGCCEVILETNGTRRDRIGRVRVTLERIGSHFGAVAMFDHQVIGSNALRARVDVPGDVDPSNNSRVAVVGVERTATGGTGFEVRSVRETRRGRDWIELDMELFNADNGYHRVEFELIGIGGNCRDGHGASFLAFGRYRADLAVVPVHHRIVCTADDSSGSGRIGVRVDDVVVRQLPWNPASRGGPTDRRAGNFARREGEINETGGLPDLAIGRMWFEDVDGTPSLGFVRVENLGDAASPPDVVRFTIPGGFQLDLAFPSVAPGESWSGQYRIVSSSHPCWLELAQGEPAIRMHAEIDPAGRHFERNESNDSASAPLLDVDAGRSSVNYTLGSRRNGTCP